MKVSHFSAVRAITSLIIGVLLIQYREQMVTWLTVTIGALFFISGFISCLGFYYEKDKIRRIIAKNPDLQQKPKSPMFPLAGIGSVCIGIVLAVIPNTFLTWMAYILAILIVIGAINLFMNLASSRQYAYVPFYYWLFPTAILIVAGLVIAKPMQVASMPLLIIGWLSIFYGIIELAFLFLLIRVKRQFERDHPTIMPIEDNDIQLIE